MSDPTTRRRWLWTLAGLTAGFAVVAAPMLLPAPWRDSSVVQLGSLVLCVLVALPLFYLGWRSSDEVVTQAHKDAFIAAGSLGGLLTLLALIATLILMKTPGPFGLTPESVGFMLVGVLLSGVVTTLFYVAFLVAWWRR